MQIAIIGLGLIGGSLAKALKENTEHTVIGFDRDENTLLDAFITLPIFSCPAKLRKAPQIPSCRSQKAWALAPSNTARSKSTIV